MAIAALVLDLGLVRANRATSTLAADAAATAGAVDVEGGNGRAGCETALSYLELNLPGVTTLAGATCISFPTSCDASTPVSTTTGSSGNWVATITYPVADGSPLMDPSAIGAGTQTINTDDGDQCERIGVSLTSTHQHLFANVLGATSQSTDVSAVARSDSLVSGDLALNLLVLERYDCKAITASGSGGGSGGIVVDAVYNPVTGELDPGLIAVDSDASSGCSGGVLDVSGTNAYVRADGGAGCASELGTHIGAGGLVVGEGCGTIRILAPGTPGCNAPACVSSGTVAPDPQPLRERMTRAPVDHRYNCKATYPFPAGWEIEGCTDPPAAHIDSLVAAYGTPNTTPPHFDTWKGDAGLGCTIPGGVVTLPAGNWRVDCNKLNVNGTVIFEGGNVIFDGDVSIASGGLLAINTDPSGSFPYSPASSEAIAYFRDGELKKAGGASLLLYNTTVYFSETSQLSMGGGTGTVSWTAPTSGDFDDLAMWSESPTNHGFAGQAGLELEGVFFAPWAEVAYSGNGSQNQVEAQFIARALSAGGNGRLVVRPTFDRAVLFPDIPRSKLIR
jgi:hypothetical protein